MTFPTLPVHSGPTSHGHFSFSLLTGGRRIHPLAWLHRQLLVIAVVFYVAAVALFIAAGLSGCATPGRTVGLAIGAALVAGAAHHGHDAGALPDVRTPASPCARTPELCR
jgi:ABC-type branched-subunit amino acid transport system permease subunit